MKPIHEQTLAGVDRSLDPVGPTMIQDRSLGDGNDLVLSRVLFQVAMKDLGLGQGGDVWLAADANGKPHRSSREGRGSLHVSSADTAGKITWAFSRHGPLGCDVEWTAADNDRVAENRFADQELADYRALSGGQKLRRFLT